MYKLFSTPECEAYSSSNVMAEIQSKESFCKPSAKQVVK